MTDTITVTMPYFADVSVNRYKTRTGIIKRSVVEWSLRLSWAIWGDVHIDSKPRRFRFPIYIGIEIIALKRGHLPDTENFRKVIHDAVAKGMSVDDQQFVAWQEMSPPARRPREGEQSAIIVRVKGA